MKQIITLLIALFLFNISFSQKNKTSKGPVINDFGGVYRIKNPDLLLDKGKNYKVIFDVYTDVKNKKDLNSSIVTVARFLNMHAQTGIDKNDLNIVLVMHGAATKNALTNKAFEREFNMENPNFKLLKDLNNAGVKIYVCGQSFAHKGYTNKDLSKSVKISLSALTALIKYQSEGYQLITFN